MLPVDLEWKSMSWMSMHVSSPMTSGSIIKSEAANYPTLRLRLQKTSGSRIALIAFVGLTSCSQRSPRLDSEDHEIERGVVDHGLDQAGLDQRVVADQATVDMLGDSASSDLAVADTGGLRPPLWDSITSGPNDTSYCGLRMGRAECLSMDGTRYVAGDDFESLEGPARLPGGQTLQVAGQLGRGCALSDLETTCWGMPEPPRNDLTGITIGVGFACGLDPLSSVVCWGDMVLLADDEPFRSVRAGTWSACGQQQEGGLRCWTLQPNGLVTESAVPLHVSSFDLNDDITCLVEQDGMPFCFGFPEARTFENVPLNDIAINSAGVCALGSDGSVRCKAFETGEFLAPPSLVFRTFVAASTSFCGITDDDALRCWGRSPPPF